MTLAASVGMSLALMGATTTLTDMALAMPLLRHNVDANFGPTRGDETVHAIARDKGCTHGHGDHRSSTVTVARPTVCEYVWGEERPAAVPSFDTIVASDVIYDRCVSSCVHGTRCGAEVWYCAAASVTQHCPPHYAT